VTRAAETTEVMEVVAKLSGLDLQTIGEFTAADLFRAGSLKRTEAIQVERKPQDRGLGDTLYFPVLF
jgi:hypothetical protein